MADYISNLQKEDQNEVLKFVNQLVMKIENKFETLSDEDTKNLQFK